ncbi:hypothetical protein [Methylobacillus sp. Pita1]|uniref:hypothetical protein n=1 Tax=Methylobacillus sp. Pita1 TaxID=3382642 RepID=UPI0038B49CDA
MNQKPTSRIINMIIWLWIWLSSVMLPVTTNTEDFWSAKIAQLFTINPNIQDIPRLIGNAILPLILWFIIDRVLKRKNLKANNQ